MADLRVLPMAVIDQVMDALESDADVDQRRTAFEAVQKCFDLGASAHSPLTADTSAHAELLRRLAEAEKWLRLELEGPCCPGPAIHDQGADALREARAAIAQMAQQRDIELERATEYRERWQRAEAQLHAAEARVRHLETAVHTINAIRNSIIGRQDVNWSRHIYPLVAALEEAGIKGEGYELSRQKAETEIAAYKAEAEAARAPLLALVRKAQVFMRHAPTCHHATDDAGELTNAYRMLGPCDCGRDECAAELEAALGPKGEQVTP